MRSAAAGLLVVWRWRGGAGGSGTLTLPAAPRPAPPERLSPSLRTFFRCLSVDLNATWRRAARMFGPVTRVLSA